MELRQLEYFVAVAEEANFTRAARRLHISQPGISAQIRQLERELGQPLLDRSGRAVRLTDVGAAMLPHARAALDAASTARLVVDQLAGLVRGTVAVGMVCGCALPLLADLLAEFHHRYPGVGVSLTEAGSDELLAAVADGRLDLALIGTAGSTADRRDTAAPTAGLEASVIVDDPHVAGVAPGDELAARSTITVAGLRDRRLVCLPRGTGVRAALDGACAAAGFQPTVVLEASSLAMVAHLGGLGLGVAILPASTTGSYQHALHVLRVTRPEIRARLEVVWDLDAVTRPAGRALVDHARSYLQRVRAELPVPAA